MKEHQQKIFFILSFVCFFLLLVSIGTKGVYTSEYYDSNQDKLVWNKDGDKQNGSVHGYTGTLVMDCFISFIAIPASIFLVTKKNDMTLVKIYSAAMVVFLFLRIVLEITALAASKYRRQVYDNILDTLKHGDMKELMIHYRDASNYAYFSLVILNLLLIGQVVFTYKQVKDEAEGTSVA